MFLKHKNKRIPFVSPPVALFCVAPGDQDDAMTPSTIARTCVVT
jgi:hypothetical protein